MQSAKEFRVACKSFRQDQQSWTNRFHGINKKLCGPIKLVNDKVARDSK